MEKIVIATGGFDPIHGGHISYLNSAKNYGDKLIVGVNSDDWLTRKKGRPFMKWVDRAIIIDSLKPVYRVMAFNDDDGTAIDCIKQVMELYPGNEYIFVNGGDRINTNTPELEWAKLNANSYPNLKFVFCVGGDTKQNSSSWLLEKWKNVSTENN